MWSGGLFVGFIFLFLQQDLVSAEAESEYGLTPNSWQNIYFALKGWREKRTEVKSLMENVKEEL